MSAVPASTANGPRFLLPGEHFAAALVFLVLAALGAVWQAPMLAIGGYTAHQVLAVVHCITLGWFTTSIMGAMYQFLPVAVGVPIASERLGHASFACYTPGVLAFTAGLAFEQPALLLAGVVALAVGATLFIANAGLTLRRATTRDTLWWALAWALVFLVVTLILGAALSANLRLAFLGAARPIALGAHLHIALAGWVLLSIIGVSQRLFPMFLLSHGGTDRYARWAVRLTAAGSGALSLLHHVPVVGRWLPAILIAGGLAAFLAQVREYYAHRFRKALDVGMRLSAMSLGGLGLALPFALLTVAGTAPPRVQVAYVALVLTSVSAFVAAHYYKIVPFLVWNHRFGPLAGTRPLPRVGELYSTQAAWASASLYASGSVLLVLSAALGVTLGVRAGAALFAAGALVTSIQMVALFRRHP
ncbi:MAG: hypothetical protein U0164_15915 [Gemmatimonadaceae bacterium]